MRHITRNDIDIFIWAIYCPNEDKLVNEQTKYFNKLVYCPNEDKLVNEQTKYFNKLVNEQTKYFSTIKARRQHTKQQ